MIGTAHRSVTAIVDQHVKKPTVHFNLSALSIFRSATIGPLSVAAPAASHLRDSRQQRRQAKHLPTLAQAHHR